MDYYNQSIGSIGIFRNAIMKDANNDENLVGTYIIYVYLCLVQISKYVSIQSGYY